MGTQHGRRVIGIVAAACVGLAGLTGPAAAATPLEAMRPATTTTTGGWTITDVVRVGQQGFSHLGWPKVTPKGDVVVAGARNGVSGTFLRSGANVTTLSAASGTIVAFVPLPNGDVLFATGFDVYLWRSDQGAATHLYSRTFPGMASDGYYADSDLRHVTSDNRWISAILVSGEWNTAKRWDLGLTDGVTRTSIVQFNLDNRLFSSDGCYRSQPPREDVVSTYSFAAAVDLVGYVRFRAPTQCPEDIQTWSIELHDTSGGAAEVLAAGTLDLPYGNGGAGTPGTGGTYCCGIYLFLNDRRQAAALRTHAIPHPTRWYEAVKQEVVVFGPGTERIVATYAPTITVEIKDLDQEGRVLFLVNDWTRDDWSIYYDAERVIGTGDVLFGQAVSEVYLDIRAASPGQNSNQMFAFRYTLADGTVGIALAHKVPIWSNPAGGSWGTGANWSTGSVPGADATVRFGPDATYAVDLGMEEKEVQYVFVEDGDVTLRNGNLTVTGTSSLLDVSGALTDVVRLTIGPNVFITADVGVGALGGPGILSVKGDLLMQGGSLRLGSVSPATVTLESQANWVDPALEVELCCENTLLHLKDSWMGLGKKVLVGSEPFGLVPNTKVARVVVEEAVLGPFDEMIVGDGAIGVVDVYSGGAVSTITSTIGVRERGAATDGFLTVDGVGRYGASGFRARGETGAGGLFASTAAGTDSVIQVSGGGAMTLAAMSLAHAAGSSAYMAVDGTAGGQSSGRRSTVAVSDEYTPTLEGGECVVGRGGRGTLQVTNGALLRCRRLAVGYLSGSRGVLEVDGFLGDYAEIAVADPDGDEVFGPLLGYGAICVGAAPLCDPTSGAPRANVQGEMLVGADGYVTARVVVVGAGGRLLGNGIVSTDDGVLVANGGRVAPGVIQLTNPRGMRTTTETLGTLTIEGGLTVSPGGVISLSVLGPTASQQDLLVVSGTLDMRGQVALIFGNGYAPKAGETLELMRAMTMTSASPTVTISGLADGFAYEIDGVGDALTLTALNDGVPETTDGGEAGSQVFVPLVRR